MHLRSGFVHDRASFREGQGGPFQFKVDTNENADESKVGDFDKHKTVSFVIQDD
jgi:hypothetical protein